MLMFLILTIISFPFIFPIFIPIFQMLGLEFWGLLLFLPVWVAVYMICLRLELIDSDFGDDIRMTYHRFHKKDLRILFITPMFAHIAVLHFCRMCRFACLSVRRYGEVVEYVLLNPRRVPLEEIGAEETKEFDYYIYPLMEMNILHLMEGEPIGVRLTEKFKKFCIKNRRPTE